MAKSQIGLVGLAVMGENLALNIERNGFPITVYNRSTDKTEALLAGRAKGKKFTARRRAGARSRRWSGRAASSSW
jgi:6-phosphogluconate dehydrogenase